MKQPPPSTIGRLPIAYRISPVNPDAHLFRITLTVGSPDPAGQTLSLPTWIPGSYLIREFAKNIVEITASSGKRTRVALVKLDKNTWRAAPVKGELTVTYTVYAWDLSVRSAHLDSSHAFFNGTSVFLRVHGHEDQIHTVVIEPPVGKRYADWQLATTLTEDGAQRQGFGTYRADGYDALVDHPVEMGTFQRATFKAHGVPHEIAVTGRVPNLDLERLCADLKKVCETQIGLFEPKTLKAPFQRYLFLVTVLADGYGGLEHRSSTALICSRDALPAQSHPVPPTYSTFLGLASHEYFHSWNVKRIKPARFAPYDFDRENYTSLLWIFEGFTSYYDDLMLVRSGLISEAQYLSLLGTNYSEVQQGSGRRKQSVAESSFDAWIKYYRQDENAANAVVSYYKKGALIGLALDLLIRIESKNRKSLDDVMRLLWRRYGRDFYPKNAAGLGEDEFADLVRKSTGVKVQSQVADWAYGTVDPPLAELLAPFGISLQPAERQSGHHAASSANQVLGARVANDGTMVRLAAVRDDGAAQAAGLSAGDILVAIDGLRVVPGGLESILARYTVGQSIVVHAFRRDELRNFDLLLAPGLPVQWVLKAKSTQNRRRIAWLRPQ